MKRFILGTMIGCLVLSLCSISLFSQPWPPLPEFSLDDYPNAPFTGPWVPPYGSAENEWGQLNTAFWAGYIGPSPSLLFSPAPPPNPPLYDSDVLTSFLPPGVPPGHLVLLRFVPPPPMGSPYYMDAISTNNWEMSVCDTIFVEFSVDRATGGATPADALWNQSLMCDQPADIYRVDNPGFAHCSLFIPLPQPVAVPPPGPPIFPWTNYCGGLIDPANGFTMANGYARPGPAGMGGGGNNWQLLDQAFHLGLLPAAPVCPMSAGSHDNIDAYNRWLYSLVNSPNTDIYFCLHPASAFVWGPGISAADIFNCTQPGGLYWPATGIYAQSWQMGLDISSGTYKPNEDSIDGVAVFDNGISGVLEPKIDFVGFTLAPGSATLIALNNLGYPANAATIFVSDFQTNPATGFGFFYVYLIDSDIGVGSGPSSLPGVPFIDINVDALELTIDPEPLPYTNPVIRPIIDPVTKK